MFTIADYRDWPDSFEQSARDREVREARAKQMWLEFPETEEEQGDA